MTRKLVDGGNKIKNFKLKKESSFESKTKLEYTYKSE